MAPSTSAAAAMNRLYRWQRHVYDATRKFYLLGRDPLIVELDPPRGGAVLEIACGTGRNLIHVARRYPNARCYGLDVSSEMLVSARRAVARAGLQDRVRLALGDGLGFEPAPLFDRSAFDRIIISYAVSMIDAWPNVIRKAVGALAQGGSLHVVDFGRQERVPALLRCLLLRWLRSFGVTPRNDLGQVMADVAVEFGARFEYRSSYRGYVQAATITLPPSAELPVGSMASARPDYREEPGHRLSN